MNMKHCVHTGKIQDVTADPLSDALIYINLHYRISYFLNVGLSLVLVNNIKIKHGL